ncbi:MAG: glycosyltransferase [candidate division WOR-3 bacterium]
MRKKILISAYACHPHRGSEHGIGWYYSVKLSNYFDIFVLTRSDNMGEIEEEIRKQNIHNIKFYYFDLPRVFRFWKKGGRGLYIYYVLWQLGALFKIIKLNKIYKFDAVWHLTFGNINLPFFTGFAPAPFIIGPVGGGDKVPFSYWRFLSLRGVINEILRNLVIFLNRHNFLLYFFFKKALWIYVRTIETMNLIPAKFRKKVSVFMETAFDSSSLTCNSNISKDLTSKSTITFITVGRILWHKGIELSLHFLKEFSTAFPNFNWEYHIVGNGPEKKRIIRIAKKLGIYEKIKFLGEVPRYRVFEFLKKADFFLLLSFKEGGAWALIEAMACGVIPVVVDAGGLSDIVEESCGIKLYSLDPNELIKGLVNKIGSVLQNPILMQSMRARAVEKVTNDLTWEKRLDLILEVLRDVLC